MFCVGEIKYSAKCISVRMYPKSTCAPRFLFTIPAGHPSLPVGALAWFTNSGMVLTGLMCCSDRATPQCRWIDIRLFICYKLQTTACHWPLPKGIDAMMRWFGTGNSSGCCVSTLSGFLQWNVCAAMSELFVFSFVFVFCFLFLSLSLFLGSCHFFTAHWMTIGSGKGQPHLPLHHQRIAAQNWPANGLPVESDFKCRWANNARSCG